MNEELKIIIRAVTDEAKKNLAEVKQELDKIETEGKAAGKTIDTSMKSVAKAVAVAIGAITALTAAMVNLGKKSLEVQKQFSKLNAGFQAAGSTAEQAATTYKNLYRFLGDSDRSTEAAQSLARITTNTEDLAEWTTILQGVYSRAGNAIPVESLAEAANETIQVGKVTGTLADALNWVGVSEDAFNEKLAQTSSLQEREILLRQTLNGLYSNAAGIYERNNQSLIAYNESQAKVDTALAQASAYLLPLMTNLNNLSATFLTVFAPALKTVAAYLTAFIQLIAEAISWVGNFFGVLGSKASSTAGDIEGYNNAMREYNNALKGSFSGTNSELQKTGDNINKVKKQLLGFDELNVVAAPEAAASIGGTGGGSSPVNLPQMPMPEDYGLGGDTDLFGEFKEDLEEAKEKLKVILTIAGIIAGTVAAWKIASFIADLSAAISIMKNAEVLSTAVFGKKMVEKAETYLDKTKNIAGNFLLISGAIAAVMGYSDAWVNGINWGNFAAVLGGVAAIVGGLTLKFGAFGGGIGAAVGGVAMLVLGIKDMIENGASLENILMVVAGAIAVVTGALMMMGAENTKAIAGWIAHTAAMVASKVALIAQKVATVAMTAAQTALNLVMNMSPIGWIITIIGLLVAAFVTLWNKCESFREFWKNLWEGIKKVFSAAWEGIKSIFSGIGNFFTGIWNTIKKIFTGVGETIGNAISGAVKGAINAVLSLVVNRINGFISAINLAIKIINAIPGVDIKEINKLNVPKLARGGIVNSATLSVIGEAGKEAVLPLENNTGWIDMLADRIAARNNTPSKIVLAVDGRELGYATVNSINDITRQTGTLPLAVY